MRITTVITKITCSVVLATLGCGIAKDKPDVARSLRYRLAAQWPLGGSTGWDYLTLDPTRPRLYVSRGDRVEVVDTQSGKIAATIANTSGVHGVALAPDLRRGYTSNGRANSVTAFDLDSLQTLQEAPVSGANPDAILFLPSPQQLITFNGRSHDASVLDANTLKLVATIALPGKPEFAVDDGHGHVFANIETDPGQIVAIDIATLKVTATWTLDGCNGPSGLALDQPHARLFSVCDDKVMAVTDAVSGRAVARVAIGDGPDGVMFDSARQLIFSSNGEGSLTIVHEDNADKYSVVQTLTTQPGARTLSFDSQSRRIYSVTADYGAPPAATAEQPRPRAPIVPGSPRVLVMEPRR